MSETNISLATLASITSKIGSGATPRGGKESYQTSGITLIRSLNVYDFHFEYDGLAFIDDKQAHELDNVEVKENDILLNITGASVARCCMVPERILPARVNQHVAIIRVNPETANAHYVFYVINSPQYKNHLLTLAQGGATREALTKETIEKFAIPLPPLPTQRKIADILSAYDDLIENNTRRIRILEQMAQAVYREWFVHFRFPGHEGVDVVETEIGKTPKGWEIRRFSDVVQIDPTIKMDKDAEKPFVDMGCLTTNSMIVECNVVRKGNSGSKFQNNDVLFPRITPSVENGKGGFVQFLKPDQAALGSTEFIVLRSLELCPEYVYFLSRQNDFRGTAINSMLGASGRQRVQSQCFDSYLLAKPPALMLRQFSDIVSPMFRITQVLAEKNANLRRTRDLLLPRLVGGDVEITHNTRS